MLAVRNSEHFSKILNHKGRKGNARKVHKVIILLCVLCG